MPATVLIVEEDHQLRHLIGRILDGAGYRVLEARTENQARQLLQADCDGVDLVVLDSVWAPEPMGERQKILLLSAESAADATRPTLQKPFKPADLITAVHNSLL
jgi:DNA-binding NtrC family response regulator